MKDLKSASSGKPLVYVMILFVFIISVSFITGCASTGQMGGGGLSNVSKEHKYNIVNNTYTDETHNFQVTLPNAEWTIKPTNESLGDAIQIAALERDEYSLFTSLSVSKHYQKSLNKFASVGTYNPKESKFTYIAGKSAFYMSKTMNTMGFELNSITYKFVNDGKGYLFSIAYPVQFTGHEPLHVEIDELLNSFNFLDEEKGVKNEQKISVSGSKGMGKLSNVAVLDMIDLGSDKPSEKTTILTNELQNILTGTGKFECIDRRNMERIIEEQDLQQSGMVSGASAMKIGQLFGAHYLISSNLGRIGETNVIYIQITNAENGKIIKTASSRCRKCSDDMLLESISRLVAKFTSL